MNTLVFYSHDKSVSNERVQRFQEDVRELLLRYEIFGSTINKNFLLCYLYALTVGLHSTVSCQ